MGDFYSDEHLFSVRIEWGRGNIGMRWGIFVDRCQKHYICKKLKIVMKIPLKVTGIYKITNLVNNKVYIGQSKRCDKRKYDHFRNLKNNKHCNDHLQKSYNKYGKENFKFEVIEKCKVESLVEKETYWINYYNSLDSNYGYNLIEVRGRRKYMSKLLKEKHQQKINNGECIVYVYDMLQENYIKLNTLNMLLKNGIVLK